MPHYISLMRWTSQGRMGLPAWRDRIEDGEREIEEAGGRLVGVWVTLGRYDVVEIFEARNPQRAAALGIEAGVQGLGSDDALVNGDHRRRQHDALEPEPGHRRAAQEHVAAHRMR